MKTKFFRVAVEGATTDGRTIERSWLQDMAETYNRETYAARVNMEHIRGITADPPFVSLGDVLGLKTEEITLDLAGKQEKRLALFAELDVLDPLVEMNRKGQKLFTSIEVNPNFAGTGKAYMVGLAVTDSPASLGTEMLTFAATAQLNPLGHRKQDPGNLFTAAEPAEIELVEDPAAADPTGIFASVKALLDKFTPVAPTKVEPAPAQAALEPGVDASAFAALGTVMTQLATGMDKLAADNTAALLALRTELDGFKVNIENTPASGFTQRPPATGDNGGARADC